MAVMRGSGGLSRRELLFYLGASSFALVACGSDSEKGTATGGSTPSTAAANSSSGGVQWGMNPEAAAAWAEVESAANQEGKVVYYAVGSLPADQAGRLQELFAKDYPDIEIQYLNPGNNSAVISKVITEQQSGNVVGDLVETSMGNVGNIGPQYMLEFTAPAARDPEAKMAFDPVGVFEGQPRFTGTMAQNYGIWYNTNDISPDEAPKNYQDLTDPKYKDLIVWRQPWNTGGGNHTYRFLNELYGDEWIQKMRDQNMTFVEDQDAGLLQVARGEYAIGMGLAGRQGGTFIEQGMPLAVSWPTDLNVRVTNGVIIQKDAPNTNAAKVLANWLISPPGQELWRELGQYPIDTNIPPLYDWQQGYDAAEHKEENLLSGPELEKLLDEAKADFQR